MTGGRKARDGNKDVVGVSWGSDLVGVSWGSDLGSSFFVRQCETAVADTRRRPNQTATTGNTVGGLFLLRPDSFEVGILCPTTPKP
jgi:hypothetical protein